MSWFAFFCCDMHQDQKQLWRKGFSITYSLHSSWQKSGQELKAGIERQELKQELWRITACWAALCGVLSYTSCLTLGQFVQLWHCPQWAGPPMSRKCPQTCLQEMGWRQAPVTRLGGKRPYPQNHPARASGSALPSHGLMWALPGWLFPREVCWMTQLKVRPFLPPQPPVLLLVEFSSLHLSI